MIRMSEIPAIIKKLRSRFQKKSKEAVTNQDALGAYPLRMQISAIPERRYLRTARLLTILSFINMAVMMILAGVFAYNAVRLDVSIANSSMVNLYAIDPENKVLQAAEYDEIAVPAMTLAVEKAFRNYITDYFSVDLDPQKQVLHWGPASTVENYTNPKMLKDLKEKTLSHLLNYAQKRGLNQEAHVYSIRQTPGGAWEALLDVFEMKPRNPFNPICNCDDNSRECLTCKGKNNQGRRRYRVFIRGLPLYQEANIYNPLGIMIDIVSVLPQPIHPNETYWGIPPVLRPEL